MKFYIRDYTGKEIECQIPDDVEIKEFYVIIISGDEIVDVDMADGRKYSFDSSRDRIYNFYDGGYDVPKDKLEEWNNVKGSSYDRMRHFCHDEDELCQ